MSEHLAAPIAGLIDQLKQVIEVPGNSGHHVSHYFPASELEATLDLALGAKGCDPGQLTAALQSYLHHTPKTWHPDFNKLLFSGLDGPALLADWVTSLSNSTMHTYQVAPVATLMEQELIRNLNQLIGFARGDGIMVSGGSMANMVAMLLARHRQQPQRGQLRAQQRWRRGLHQGRRRGRGRVL